MFGGYFESGGVYIDPILKDPNQRAFFYSGEPLLKYFYLTGETYYFTPTAVLAHELLGHGLEWVRGGPGRPYSLPYSERQKQERISIEKANKVERLLGIPLRYR
jgi:hypothetical protein